MSNPLDALLFGVRTIVVNGVSMAARSVLSIEGDVTAVDDSANGATKITVTGGGGGSGDGNVRGPVSSLLGRVSIFADATGKVIADSGYLLSDVLASIASKAAAVHGHTIEEIEDFVESIPAGQVLYEDGAVLTTTENGFFLIKEIPADELLPRQTWDMVASITGTAENGEYNAFDLRFAFKTNAAGDIVRAYHEDSTLGTGTLEVTADVKDGVIGVYVFHAEAYEGVTVEWSARIAGHGFTHGLADPPE